MHKYDYMTEPELKAHFNALARKIKAHLPTDTGFIVVCAPFGGGGVAQYASNVRRDDAVKWMRETIARWESGDFIPREQEGGSHE